MKLDRLVEWIAKLNNLLNIFIVWLASVKSQILLMRNYINAGKSKRVPFISVMKGSKIT